ncbi:MAG: type II toxin-antitoxin system VapC family toxin [Alkalispirochaeta sp.]
MTVVLDTNAYSDFKRGSESVVEALETAEEIVVPTTVLGELYAGFRLGSRQKENVTELHEFLDRPGVRVGPIDQGVARRYGDVVAALGQLGTPIPTNDIWIAAVSIEHNGELLTRDEHFSKVPILRRYG